MAGINAYVGWGVSTLALYFLNKGSRSSSESSSMDPSDLNVTETKIGTPIPVVMGTTLIKSPLTVYFGDFSSKIYTETYAAHANFNAWPLVFALIAQYIASPSTTVGKGQGTDSRGGPVTVEVLGKDMAVGPLINSLFMWLLSWLINGRNLKTTIQKGFKYYLGYQQVICWSSKNTRLKKIYMNENLIWEGNVGREEQQGAAFIIPIDDENLFGGMDESGGFKGEIHVYFGGDTQMPDGWMIKEMQRDTVQEELRGLTPAYRTFLSVVVPTAYVGKQATVPTMWYEIEDIPNNLGLEKIGDDANPAEVLYEMHVNKDWGLAEADDLINIIALRQIGEKLQKEKVGISVPLTSITTAGQLIDSICDHINAVKFSEPSNGLLTYKLIRNDLAEYKTGLKPPEEEKDLKDMVFLNESNIISISFTRLDWRETVSEIEATFTDRAALYETGSLSDSDSANVEINNGIITSKSYSYPYFTTAEQALWAVKRELMQQGYPLAAISIEGNRMLYQLRIGDVICLDFPPYGIKSMLCRVIDVNLGDFQEGKINIELLEDIFSLAKTDFGFSNSTEWKPAPLYPTGVQLFTYVELPYEIMKVADTYVFAMAVQPDIVTENWTIWRKKAESEFMTTNTMSKWTAAARLVYDYDEFTDAEDMIGIEIIDLGGIENLRLTALTNSETDIVSARRGGKVLMIGDELMAWSNIIPMPNGHYKIEGLIRGIFDTVPQAHGNGDIIYFFQSGHYANVTTGGPVCLAGNTVDEFYNITTNTVEHQEDFDKDKVRNLSTVRRAERPAPPGKIRMTAHLLYDALHRDIIAGDLSITWVPRNKRISYGCVGQSDEIDYWSQLNFEPPETLTYLVQVYNDATLLKEYTYAGTVNEFDYAWADRVKDGENLAGILGETTIKIYAKLNDLLSYQPQVRKFKWNVPVVVLAAETEALGIAMSDSWSDGKEITVQENQSSEVQRIKYAECPIVLLGTKATQETDNSLLFYDGSYYVPNGQALILQSKGEYELVQIAQGFTYCSNYHEAEESSVARYYRWNGANFIEMN